MDHQRKVTTISLGKHIKKEYSSFPRTLITTLGKAKVKETNIPVLIIERDPIKKN